MDYLEYKFDLMPLEAIEVINESDVFSDYIEETPLPVDEFKRCAHDTKIYLKRYCIICQPELMCSHTKLKLICLSCNKTDKCEHKRLRYFCVDCDLNLKCGHENYKQFCIFCYDDSKCLHDIPENACMFC